MEKKKSALNFLYEVENKKIDGKETSNEEVKNTLLSNIDHPLLTITNIGYRLYNNNKDWICYFCESEIRERVGYWGREHMTWSMGAKLCHRCFLKYLAMLEENSYLMEVLKVLEKNNEEKLLKEFSKWTGEL